MSAEDALDAAMTPARYDPAARSVPVIDPHTPRQLSDLELARKRADHETGRRLANMEQELRGIRRDLDELLELARRADGAVVKLVEGAARAKGPLATMLRSALNLGDG